MVKRLSSQYIMSVLFITTSTESLRCTLPDASFSPESSPKPAHHPEKCSSWARFNGTQRHHGIQHLPMSLPPPPGRTVLRQRSQEAIKQMAARGELFTSRPVLPPHARAPGYSRGDHGDCPQTGAHHLPSRYPSRCVRRQHPRRPRTPRPATPRTTPPQPSPRPRL